MDYILKIVLCLFLIGIYWIPIVDSQCEEVEYLDFKCQVCMDNKNCPRCKNTGKNEECRHDNRCRCKKNYGRANIGGTKTCIQANKIVEHGDDCDAGKKHFCNDDDFTFCGNSGKCECFGNSAFDPEIKLCIKGRGLVLDYCSAKTCREDHPLKCDRKQCLVKSGYKYNCTTMGYDTGEGKYNEDCDEKSCETVQPSCKPCNPDAHLECKNRVCNCMDGYFWDQSTCVRGSQEQGASCNALALCDPEQHLTCVEEICVCKYGYQVDPSNNKCFEMKQFSEDCSVINCHPMDPYLKCNDIINRCVCETNYIYSFILQKCLSRQEFTEICSSFNCDSKLNLECINRTFCDCKFGFKRDKEKHRCIEVRRLTFLESLLIILGIVILAALLIVLVINAVWFFGRRRQMAEERRISALKQEELIKANKSMLSKASMKFKGLIKPKVPMNSTTDQKKQEDPNEELIIAEGPMVSKASVKFKGLVKPEVPMNSTTDQKKEDLIVST